MIFWMSFVLGVLFCVGFVWLNQWFDQKMVESVAIGRDIEKVKVRSSLSHTANLGDRIVELETAMRLFADALDAGEGVTPWYYAIGLESDEKWVRIWKDVLEVTDVE